jgi:hypothetical protein
MNHSPRSFAAATLALLGVPHAFARAADSDFAWLLRTQYRDEALAPNELNKRRHDCKANSASYRRSLQFKTVCSFLWVLAATLLALWFVVLPGTGSIGSVNSQQLFGASSVFVFAWATLGRLGWNERSFGGVTIFEELDTIIFWLLCGAGAFLGVAAVASAA